MTLLHVRAQSYFDGQELHSETDAPFLLAIRDGAIESIARAAADARADIEAPFVMPGLVEAHAHLFLDGGELDLEKRNAYLNTGTADMMKVARANIARSQRAGITLIRDAGDRYGINHAIRDELLRDAEANVTVRSPGLGVKRPNRYGAFMARDVEPSGDIEAIVDDITRTADDVKIILTGVIDFVAGSVKGSPQFDEEELRALVAAAHARERRTFAHCSGLDGLRVAVSAGVDSIEHGFFMTRGVLERMADKGIAWVPTFSPVQFQWARPEIAGWDVATVGNLRRILDSHLEHVAIAHALGVELVAGSDAGGPGVVHGQALIDELFHFLDAGMPMRDVLRTATSRPRRLWGLPPVDIRSGNAAEFVIFEQSPFVDPYALRKASRSVYREPVGRLVRDTSGATV
ncbi:MAG: amidohydrolase family protein [Beijerinckiaceae bacterium]